MKRTLYTAAATVFGLGLIPVAPGTFGALAALPVRAWVTPGSWLLTAAIAVAVTAAGLYLTRGYLRATHKRGDPSEVVIDETAGCLIALVFVPATWTWMLVAFGLFRLFDIWKPGPIGTVDRTVPGAKGIMLDDVLAGLAAGIAGWLLTLVF